MVEWFDGFLPLAALVFGHFILWTGVFNRMHGVAVPHKLMKLSERLIMLHTIVLSGAVAWSWHAGVPLPRVFGVPMLEPLAAGYGVFCWLIAAVIPPVWLGRRLAFRVPPALQSNHTQAYDVAAQLGRQPAGDRTTKMLAAIPGNQIFDLHVHDKLLAIPELPPALDGLTIAHLTDLHYTGQIARDYFEFVIDRTNELNADLVLVTGDILDKRRCLGWVAQTLGRLNHCEGKYFILGNHDQRLHDDRLVRQTVSDAGLVDVGGRVWQTTLRGTPVLLAGNEYPWSSRPERLPDVDAEGDRPFRILLSHSPDQYHWARKMGFDLMLAGHTHGGQIRFPWIGPLVTASWHGTRYTAGVFHEPPTVMHVSRGLSGVQPIRFNCAPELAKLTLRSAS